MVTGWLLGGPIWCYLTPSNDAMTADWVKDSSSWYFAHSSGALTIRQLRQGPFWYHPSTDSGAMYVGGCRIGWKQYYFAENGGWSG